jgi:hypothetical protein
VKLAREPILEAAPVSSSSEAIGNKGFSKVNSRFATTNGASMCAGRMQIAWEWSLPELPVDLRHAIDMTT